MTTSTLTLTAFLLARIAEDEAMARSVLDARPANGAPSDSAWRVAALPEPAAGHVLRWGPLPVLAECEAKRRIVELHAELAADDLEYSGWQNLALDTLRALASVYAEHEDFREEWRP